MIRAWLPGPGFVRPGSRERRDLRWTREWAAAWSGAPDRRPGPLGAGRNQTPTSGRRLWAGVQTTRRVRCVNRVSSGPGRVPHPPISGLGGDAWVAIVDDAARPELIVYRSDDGSEVCRMPAFETSGQGTENSPMAWGNSLVIPSTYGFSYPPQSTSGPSDPPQAAFVGGMARIDVGEDGCRRVWESADRMATLPRLSHGDGLIHGLSYGPLSPGVDIQQVGPVYYTAVDFHTGERRAYQQVGIAPVDEPVQLTGTIGPDGALWQGTLGRMLKIGR